MRPERVHWQVTCGDREPRHQHCAGHARFTAGIPQGPMPELSPPVKILNPLAGGAAFLSHRHACRYVKQRRAEWVGSSTIRFLDSSHQHASAQRLAFRTQTAAGYDSRGMTTLPELQRVPVVADAMRLLIVRRRPL